MGLYPPLPSGVGVDVEYHRPGGAQVADQPLLLTPAGVEQAQDAARMAGRAGPPEIVPERPRAGLAEQRGAEMVAEPILGRGLIAAR